MKYKFYISTILFVSFLFCATTVFAISPTVVPTVSSTPSITPKVTPQPTNNPLLEKQINQLKDRIASKVAELKLTEPRGVIGTVEEVANTEITLTKLNGDIQLIDVDEFTKFSSPSAKESFGISDIKKGMPLGILGRYNKQSKRLLARFIEVEILPIFIHGAISQLDDKNFLFTVTSANGKQTKIDVENITRTTSYAKDATATKAGFSKLTLGEHIIVIGYPDKQDPSQIIASRILLFPDVPKDPKIPQIAPAINPNETITPSTGSGKKLTPITR